MRGVDYQKLVCRDRLQQIARRAMLERGLAPDLSPAARAELQGIARAPIESGPAISDLRDLPWASIDNDDSLDLDQLTAAVPGPNGPKVLVAIADVDGIVPKGSAIDAHARTNTTSVYTAAQVFPMLPEKLSTDLTSLREGEDRMAIVVELVLSEAGTVTDSSVRRAVVRNRCKLAYRSVAAWLDGKAPVPDRVREVNGLEEQLRVQDRIAQKMKDLRHRQGALALETLASRPVFAGEVLTDLRPDEKNRARELIEELMVAANGATARFLAGKRFPSLRRVLRTPERWSRIVAIARELGTRLPPQPDAGALGAFLAQRRREDPARFPDLSLSVVKLLGSGEYDLEVPGEEQPGHFGLAVKDYTHSTAPNRRFPDLVTQRLLKAALAGHPVPYTRPELAALARHCTEQEDDAARVERQVLKSAAALLLEDRIHERFTGIVTGASEKGTWVRILRPAVEGKIVRGYEDLDVGDQVQVELVHTDVEQGFIDFAAVESRRW
jgi:exoribonuclease-2